MKLLFRNLSAIAIVTLLFTGCDKLEKADDITFDVEFTVPEKFEVDEQGDSPKNPYTSLVSNISAEQNPEYIKYMSKIKKMRVNKITYTISDLSTPEGPVSLVSGTATFYENGGSLASGNVASVSNLLLTNTTGNLETSQDALDNIGEILLEQGKVSVVSVANLSAAPVHFKISVTLHVSITANALD